MESIFKTLEKNYIKFERNNIRIIIDTNSMILESKIERIFKNAL